MPKIERNAAAFAACLIVAGCSGSANPWAPTPSPVIVYVTPAVTPSPIVVYVTPPPAQPTPEITPEATPAPSPSPAASPTPVVAPTSRASRCTGNDTNKAFFAEAAARLRFDVYCAVLGRGWWVDGGSYQLPDGGVLSLHYRNSAGAEFYVFEGAFCTTSPSACSTHIAVLGSASFGGIAGTMYQVNSVPVYSIHTAPGTAHDYNIASKGLTPAGLAAVAAAFIRVPKS
jgi:hypothetical protein